MNKQSLCIIAIQAFAELNRWNEVLTFVTDVYGGIDKSPGKVVQLWYNDMHAYILISICWSSDFVEKLKPKTTRCQRQHKMLHTQQIFWQLITPVIYSYANNCWDVVIFLFSSLSIITFIHLRLKL